MFIHITAKKNEPVLLPLSLSLEKNPARKDSVPELVWGDTLCPEVFAQGHIKALSSDGAQSDNSQVHRQELHVLGFFG